MKVVPITDELNLFLKQNFLFWLEARSCMGMQTKQENPGAMLPRFLAWAEVSV